jgi:hypothetical protein
MRSTSTTPDPGDASGFVDVPEPIPPTTMEIPDYGEAATQPLTREGETVTLDADATADAPPKTVKRSRTGPTPENED